VTFDAGPPESSSPPLQLDGHAQVSVCDLTGAERDSAAGASTRSA